VKKRERIGERKEGRKEGRKKKEDDLPTFIKILV
jgi:hypothetical protein